jgi:hypothetical protein
MIPTRILIPAAAFSIGFGIAWSVKPSTKTGDDTPDAIPTRVQRPAADVARSTRNITNTRIQQHLDKLLGKNQYHNQNVTQDALRDLRKEDYPGLLHALAARAGITGLDYNEQHILGQVISQWYESEPDTALQWVLGLENKKDSSKFLSDIMGHVADKDWDAAVAMAEQYGTAQGREVDMPYSMRNTLGKLDAHELVRVLGFFTSSSGSSGSAIDFSPDFDFRAALDGLVESKKSLKNGTQLKFTPSNLVSEWAKRDFDSALAWARTGNDVSFNSITEVFSAAAATASIDELAGMAVQLMQESNQEQDQKYRATWGILANRANPELVASFIQQLPGDRQNHLSHLLATSFSGSGSSYDAFKEILLSQMTASERIAAFQSEPVQSRSFGRSREFFTPILMRLGHTQQEIDRMVPAGSTEE